MTCLLILPGWHGSGSEHWQSRWPALYGDTTRFVRVEQDDWVWPKRGDWMMRLEEALLADDRPTVLAAHSLGCHLVAAWAAVSRNAHCVHAALLVAPPDVSRGDLSPQLHSWRKPILRVLPMSAICVVSSNDPFASLRASQALARAWGARCVEAGPVGHLNAASHLADWPQGHALLLDLVPQNAPIAAKPCQTVTSRP